MHARQVSTDQSESELLRRAKRAMARADFPEAERCYRALITSAKADGGPVEAYMDCLYVQYKTEVAFGFLNRRIKKNRKAGWLRVWRARFHVLAGDLDNATRELKALLRDYPEYTALHQNLGHVYRAFGLLDKAAEHYAKAFSANPKLAEGYRLAVESTQQDRLTAVDERLLAELESGQQQHPDFYFGLANIFDRIGDVDRAWSLFETGNALVARGWPRNAQALIETGGKLAQLATRFIEANRGWVGSHTDNGVLVSGFPRSGTTMLESVIASDDRFWACGELNSGSHAATRLLARHEDDAVAGSLTEAAVAEFGEAYLQSQRRMVQGRGIGIDKATDQFRHAPLLLASCPNMRMIQLKRDPSDVILSNFKARFTLPSLAFAFTIPDLIAYLGFAMQMMNRWQDLMPDRIYTMSYDDYVSNSESANQRLATFLDFGGVAPSFSFARKRQAVITVASTQLGDRVRTNSRGKAEAYAKYLQPWAREIDALYELL